MCDSVVKNPHAMQEPQGLTLGLVRSPGGGHSNPLQYSCLENPMDRGAWWATVHRVAKSQTRLKGLSTHIHVIYDNGLLDNMSCQAYVYTDECKLQAGM